MMGGMDTLKQNKFYAQKESAHQIVEDIMVLRESYRYALRVLKEDEANLVKRKKPQIIRCSYVVRHIENVIEYLPERDRFILTNEFILEKSGKWYRDYYSEYNSGNYYLKKNYRMIFLLLMMHKKSAMQRLF